VIVVDAVAGQPIVTATRLRRSGTLVRLKPELRARREYEAVVEVEPEH
jgi:hypothetical protein